MFADARGFHVGRHATLNVDVSRLELDLSDGFELDAVRRLDGDRLGGVVQTEQDRSRKITSTLSLRRWV
jgi:hypothetical protein